MSTIYWQDARQIDMKDYDGACAILRWCGGTALGEDYDPFVMSVPGPDGIQYAQDGDWVEVASDGSFCVVPGSSRTTCLTCKGSGGDPDDPGEFIPEAGKYKPTSPCPDCKGLGIKVQQGEKQ
jgi:hypothetical protein